MTANNEMPGTPRMVFRNLRDVNMILDVLQMDIESGRNALTALRNSGIHPASPAVHMVLNRLLDRLDIHAELARVQESLHYQCTNPECPDDYSVNDVIDQNVKLQDALREMIVKYPEDVSMLAGGLLTVLMNMSDDALDATIAPGINDYPN